MVTRTKVRKRMFRPLQKLSAYLKLWRLWKKMPEEIKNAVLAIVDGALAIGEGVAKLTPTAKDDQFFATLRKWRETVRPIVGAPGPEAEDNQVDE